MKWLNVVIGAAGFIGIVAQLPKDWQSWLIGLAFLLILVSGFTEN